MMYDIKKVLTWKGSIIMGIDFGKLMLPVPKTAVFKMDDYIV